MNQCDINYRQSSNKRLLVELTLIEIAQITQPAEEGDSAGRSPRRLKSLFKHLMRQAQPKPTAPQVAAAKPVVSETNDSSTSRNSSKKKGAARLPSDYWTLYLFSSLGLGLSGLGCRVEV